MKFIDDIKEQLPIEQLQTITAQIKAAIAAKQVKKTDPVIIEAEKIMNRIHYLLSEKANVDLGKQEIYTRTIRNEDGKTKNYTYVVNFADPDQVKRLRLVLLELADLTSPDASKTKKESISGYLDYIAQTSL